LAIYLSLFKLFEKNWWLRFQDQERRNARRKNAPIGKVENVNVAEVKDIYEF
tara:strand:+ start:386 stop:541 length:156 start_codon:yes stop_codon:yes gene_type:complete